MGKAREMKNIVIYDGPYTLSKGETEGGIWRGRGK